MGARDISLAPVHQIEKRECCLCTKIKIYVKQLLISNTFKMSQALPYNEIQNRKLYPAICNLHNFVKPSELVIIHD